MPRKREDTLTSYEPSLRDRLAWLVSDTFGGGNRSKVNYLNEKVRGAADLVPFVGDVLSADEAKREFEAGNYGKGAVNAGLTLAGSVPGIGDLAAGGAKAMFIGPMSRLWNADMAKKALEMHEGASLPLDIWRETGTYMGPDRKWRQEISDEGSAINERMAQEGIPPYTDLPEFFSHPELYDAYPGLKDVVVNDLPEMDGSLGYFNVFGGKASRDGPASGVVGIRSMLHSDPRLPEQGPRSIRGTILHELQHAVQAKEGFDPGFNPTAAGNQFQRPDSFPSQVYVKGVKENAFGLGFPITQDVLDRFHYSDFGRDFANRTAMETYMRNAGEVEARNTAHRKDYDKFKRAFAPPNFSADRYSGEQLTFDDILYGRFNQHGVPGLSLRGVARPIGDIRKSR